MDTTRSAELIELARRDIEMTADELARASGVCPALLGSYERGERTPLEPTLRAILDAAAMRPSMVLWVYRAEVRAAAELRGMADVRVFGSAARGDDTEASDIDLLVTPLPDSGWGFGGFANDVETITGRSVDLLSDRSLSEYFRHVLDEAVTL